MTDPDAPTALRLLRSPDATAVTELIATFDDLQTVLRCCEQLVDELGRPDGEADETRIEALWTLALLSYARGFSPRDGGDAVLSEDDLAATEAHENALEWHRALMKLRDHYASRRRNPRERFNVGIALDDEGAASGIAVTSMRQPGVDDLTVRQAGAIAFALSGLLDERIGTRQQKIFDDVRRAAPADLERLAVIEVAPSA